MGSSKKEINTHGRAQVRAYVRRLLGSSGQSSGQGGTGGARLSIRKTAGTAGISQAPHTLPRQLEATAYTRTSKNRPSSGGSSVGNAWLISPIASTVKSLFNLFGGGTSSSTTTGYRTKSRTPFHIVESISPESWSGVRGLNESAAALTGVTSSITAAEVADAPGGIASSALMNNRQELITALRRGLSESQGIADVLNEFQDGL